MKQVVWTKRCSGKACAGDFGMPAFIADENELCDFCILDKYDLHDYETYDGCNDPYAMESLYKEEGVIAALRKAEQCN